MPLTRQQKVEIVQKTTEVMKRSSGVLFTDATGVSVSALRELRSALRALGVKYQVTKRTLTSIALREAGVKVPHDIPKNSLGLVMITEGIPQAAKALYAFAKKEKNFRTLNGYDFSESRWLSAEEVKVLATLPSREELLGQLAFMLKSPLKKLAFVVDQVAKNKK